VNEDNEQDRDTNAKKNSKLVAKRILKKIKIY
jgi:hypothetical protein